jgi:hypothetical protein
MLSFADFRSASSWDYTQSIASGYFLQKNFRANIQPPFSEKKGLMHYATLWVDYEILDFC